MEEVQEQVQIAIDRLSATSGVGIQVAVSHRGRMAVDAVSGWRDLNRVKPVEPDTLFFAASTAKGIAASVIHVLAERDQIAYDMRIADVWPEFANRGKEGMTLRHLLLHTAGLPALPYETTLDDLTDWGRMCRFLEQAEPWWEPGDSFGYHPHTFGFLVGETVRRATGRSLPWWLREITRPLGIEEGVFFGVPDRLIERVAYQHDPSTPVPVPTSGSAADRANPPGLRFDAVAANRADWLRAHTISSGTMTARGATGLYAALLGHPPGTGLVSPDRLAEMAALTFEGEDRVMGVKAEWAFGFSPFRPGSGTSRPGSTFGMVGSNGSAAFADIDSGVAVAVMRNRLDPDFSAVAEVDRVVTEDFP